MTDSLGCHACPVSDALERREFVRDVIARVLGAVGVLSLSARSALALNASFARGTNVGTEKAYSIPTADGVVIDRDESVIVARFNGRVYAFSLACPHQNTALRWEEDNHRFQCPKHHSRYQPDGTFIEGRATRGLDRFAVRRDGDQLFVDLDTLYRQDENSVGWSAAYVLAQ
jgi:nitrite reductase/ring-hydroxylating ferredoxin subunit